MRGQLIDYGHYELLESLEGRLLLIINDEKRYFWERSGNIENLQLTTGVNEKSGDTEFVVKSDGHYFLVAETTDNNSHPDVPTLYLQMGDRYYAYILSTGFPTYNETSKMIATTGRTVPLEVIDTFATHIIEAEKSKGFF